MQPKTTDTSLLESLQVDLERHARRDERVRAAWLEGSFALGTADAGSDLDLHLAVRDDAFDAFCDAARTWIDGVRRPVGLTSLTFGRRRLFAASLEDGTRLDLLVEPASVVAEPVRPVEPRILFDHDALLEGVTVDPATALSPLPRLREILNTFAFGYTFPARLAAREEWGSLHLNALLVVYQFLVPALLAVRHPEHTFRPQLHNERFLDPDQRAAVDALVVELARAFSESPPAPEAVRRAYARLETATFEAFAAAAAAHDLDWPAVTQETIRRFLRDELAIEVG